MKTNSSAILEGEGRNDYARYMKTDVLLSLQLPDEKLIHKDEMMFQIVHQSTELWLKLSCYELNQAILAIKNENINKAMVNVKRAAQAISLIIEQLSILKSMTPWDFQSIRPALGNGSGIESPGWRETQSVGKQLNTVIEAYLSEKNINLIDLYQSQKNTSLFSLMESLIDWDENVSLWRTHHYKLAVRTLGLNTQGTRGKPIEKLTRMIDRQFFPQLWKVRTYLTSSAY
ncbi:tryptophan 2,3-dioxygenase family protein [Vibrio sagamiensis]|uniref:Tryptophan 2,3-dioxygenase n=1 Tax=Vibrio sagamiensis NBRC 104589 TaxID=1219064 RepID=A0A511QE56_9VIBR|nr:tryptophan 2,3-dioxygenase family protein [Vibrio sagamiensis]PNQ57740.1 tryptophan 2,3-dioxygenase [Vibrio agarivorans]GEM75591.1 tryptophan 2,3-dioxygenase [Vibrio sagamiensis NBRC 104589]